jgi:hypothetical protein
MRGEAVMCEKVSPFVPGARVAIASTNGWYRPRYAEAFVEKAHKSGRFTLKGSSQQWRPHEPQGDYRKTWEATQTGDGWSRQSLKIWDASTDAEISAAIAEEKREMRVQAIVKRLDRRDAAQHITEAALDQIEAALFVPSPTPNSEES